MKNFRLLLILITLLTAGQVFALTTAEQADSAYNAQNFRQAAELYNKALAQLGPNTTLYYNLANSYYRLGQTGLAIANYERALRVDPSNDDARDNLNFVLSKISNLPEDNSSFLGNLHRSVVAWTSPDGWANIAFGSVVLLIAMIALYIFASNVTVRKIGFFGGIVVLIWTIYALTVAWSSAQLRFDHSDAVVIVPTSNLNTAPRTPRSADDKLIPVPEGTRLHIIDSLATPNDPQASKWYDVKINSTTRAWVNADHVQRI